MRQGLRQSMAWLHAWSGLVVGWVLFCVFVTGTASYYRADISRWMRPELTAVAASPERSAALAQSFLARTMPNAAGWYITLPKPDEPVIAVHWWKSLDGPFHSALLDPRTGAPTRARATHGGDFLYRFHFELSMPPMLGRYVVGACALIMLVALVSGIVTHRRIFADFFTFRRRSSPQRSWLDAHNVAGVLALPFHLMIAYSGLVTLAPMYMPWGVQSAYGRDEARFFVEAGLMPELPAPLGRPGTLAPLGPIVAAATARAGSAPEDVAVYNTGDAGASVVAVFAEPHGLAHQHPQIAFDGQTGALLGTNGPVGPSSVASTTLVGLHEAHFAGPALRLVFLLCGILGAATVATGLVLWAVARAPKGAEPAGLGLRLVGVLNLGTIVGLPVGIALYFLGNRLLPIDLPARATWEVGLFFGAWALVALLAVLRAPAHVWPEALALAALAFGAVPLADALTTGLGAETGAIRFLGFDLAMLALAAGFAFAARKASRRGARPARRPTPARTGEEAVQT